MPTPSDAATTRVLVLRPGAIGDTLVTLPALLALRRHYPNASIQVLGNPTALPIAAASGLIDSWLPFDDGRVTRLFTPSEPPSDDPFLGIDVAVAWGRDADGTLERALARRGAATVIIAPSRPDPSRPELVARHLLRTLAPLGIQPPGSAPPGSQPLGIAPPAPGPEMRGPDSEPRSRVDPSSHGLGSGGPASETAHHDVASGDPANDTCSPDVETSGPDVESTRQVKMDGGEIETRGDSIGASSGDVGANGGDIAASGHEVQTGGQEVAASGGDIEARSDGDIWMPSGSIGASSHDVGPSSGADIPLPELRVPAEADTRALAELAAAGLADRPFVAIHPGSGSATKNWPAEQYAVLVDQLQSECGLASIILGGSADAETLVLLHDQPGQPPAAEVVERPLLVVAALLRRATAFLGNDSGLSHLAGLLGVPTLALFGPSDPILWAPLGPRVRVVRSASLPTLPAETVLAELIALLDASD